MAKAIVVGNELMDKVRMAKKKLFNLLCIIISHVQNVF